MASPLKRPFWRYYGGKFRAARHYPQPQHNTIVEPFAGAAGYACRHHDRNIILIDASEKVCGVWDYLINASAKEILSLPDLEPGRDVRSYGLTQEAGWFLGFWCNSGAAVPCRTPSKWAIRDERRLANWNAPQTRPQIAAQVEMISHWRVIHGTYNDAPDIAATWFVDPPYQGAQGAHYPNGSTSIDYADLSAWCQRRDGQTIVCEGPSAKWLPFQPFKRIQATPTRSRTGYSVEMLWEHTTGIEETPND